MKEKQGAQTTATRNKFDGDGRDERYWEQRESLLSYQSVQTLLKDARADAEMVLEILVSTFLLHANGGAPRVNNKSVRVIETAVPLITAELDQEEEMDLISAINPKFDETNPKWLH